MKKLITTIIILLVFFPSLLAAHAAFPQNLTNWISGNIITSSWLNAVENLLISSSTSPSPLGTINNQATTTGNILVASSSSGWNSLVIGANGRVLTASSTASLGVSWEPSAGGVSGFTDASVASSSGSLTITTTTSKFTLTIPSNLGFFVNDSGYIKSAPATSTIIVNGGTITGPAFTLTTSTSAGVFTFSSPGAGQLQLTIPPAHDSFYNPSNFVNSLLGLSGSLTFSTTTLAGTFTVATTSATNIQFTIPPAHDSYYNPSTFVSTIDSLSGSVIATGTTNQINVSSSTGQIVFSISPSYSPSSTIPALPVSIANGGTATTTTPGAETILQGNGTTYELRKLTAGTNITIATTSNSLTINSTAAGGGGSASTTYQYSFPLSDAALPTTNFASFNIASGTNWIQNVLTFNPTSTYSAFWNTTIDDSNVGSVGSSTLFISWYSTVATGTVTFTSDYRCSTSSALWDSTTLPAPTHSTSTLASSTTANAIFQSSIALSASSVFGLSGAESCQFKISMPSSTASIGADVNVTGIQLELIH